MIVTKSGVQILITLETEEEQIVVDHLIETRGTSYLLEAFSHWFKIRTDTVKDELRTKVIEEQFKGKGIKELRDESKKVRK